ncbi:MAG: DUF1501 domain-containing protein [Planctomycetia bacterium]|nr:DUF1501 domain-containing protein [Planctomycetia bacterium]
MILGCDTYRRMNRREFLRVGGTGLFGLNMPTLFQAQAQANAAKEKPRAQQLLILWQGGGPPHIDMFDMKPDAPEEIRGAWKPIQTALPGLLTNELMPGLARSADKYTILRSVNAQGYHVVQNHSVQEAWPHLTGNRRGLPGMTPPYPLYGSVMGKVRPGPRDLPANVIVSTSSEHDSAHDSYLGPGYHPMTLNINDPSNHLSRMLAPPPAQLDVPTLERRIDLLRDLDTQLRHLDRADPIIGGLDRFQQQAFDLLRSPKLRRALDLRLEPDRVADRYGKHSWGRQALAARRLIEVGVPCVFLNFYGWDFHGTGGPNAAYDSASRCYREYNTACTALLEDLDERGLLDRTIVLSGGEMGRTPKPEATRGSRNHWYNAQHFLVAGGGFQRGCLVGSTDKIGGEVSDRYYKIPSLARTIYHLLGIDPDQELHTPDGRPLKIVLDDAPLIREALA